MRFKTRSLCSGMLRILIALSAFIATAGDDHLLICEAVLTPTSDEYIEITNPTDTKVSLDNYYLSDDDDYALLPGQFGNGPAPSIGDTDFIAQFPPGSTIAPGQVIVVAFSGAGFFSTFGSAADFEILSDDAGTPDMVATMVGATAGLTNSGENAVLFYWDGASDLVQDVDMVNLGTPSSSNDIGPKTGVSVDGPDADTDASTYNDDALTIPLQLSDPGFGFSTKRIFLEGSEETAGGNGLTGDDETSENIQVTWDSTFTAPDPGVCGPLTIPVPAIVINEVDADTPGTDEAEFIELYGPANTSLDGLVVVLFNGNGDTSYAAYDLDGFSTDANGFFLLGNSGVPGVSITFASNGLQNGADAVALYVDDATNFPDGTPVTDTNLIDALVYDTNDSDDTGLIDVLTPGQPQLNEDELGDKDGHSNSRLPDGGSARDTSTYTQQTPTPGASNEEALPPAIVINEVDADTEGTDIAEFVELYGDANMSLDGLVVVFFNGSSDTSYAAYDLDGFSTDANGFFVLGNEGVPGVSITFPSNGLQNGADAVALYQDDATTFPNSTPVTATNLLDALVYDTNDADDTGLIDVLTPGKPQLNEDALKNAAGHSNSRVPNGGDPFDTTSYTQQEPTPGATNVMGGGMVDIVINEVDADTEGTDIAEFVELYGTPNQPLDGLVVVFFNGSDDASYAAYDLDGYSTDANGFFVLGNEGVPGVSLTFPSNGLQNGADAVAIFQDDAINFPEDTPVTNVNLIDAVVYDTNDNDDSGLIDVLTPGKPQVNEGGNGNNATESNSRVPDGGAAFDTDVYVQQAPTPGASNVAIPTVVINEVDADTAGTDTLEFVELFGDPNGILDGFVIVLYNGNGDVSYDAYDLDGYTLDENGFFVMGNAAVENVDLVIADNIMQNGADAVALYRGDATDFSNTPVTATNLVDALVYDTNDADDSGLIDVLTPGNPQQNEDGQGDKDGHSNSRIPDGGTALDTTTYTQQAPTPGAPNQPPPELGIAEIQGNGLESPVRDTVVTTRGNIVTAVTSNGFFMQAPDETDDADPDTSEGIFVFSNAKVAVGDMVDVTGEVVEYFDFTEFSNDPIVNVTSSGNPLPAAIALDMNTPSNTNDDPLSMERLEGMLVTVSGAVASGPTDRFGDLPIVIGHDQPFREPGLIFPGMKGLPVWDGNPEIFEVNTAAGATEAPARRGAVVSASGPIGFSFGDYQINATTLTVDNNAAGGLTPRPVRPKADGEFTVGSQNMLRLFSSNGNYADQLTKLSMLVRNVLGSPDVLGVQEVGSINELTDLANRITSDDPTVEYTPYLMEGNDPGGIDVGFLVRNSVTVNNLYQVQPDENFDFNGSSFTLHDRPPLVLEGVYHSAAEGDTGIPFTIMNIHNRSLVGLDDPGSGDFRRTKRHLQATRISEEIQIMQTANSDIALLVIGDYNAFEFTDGYVDVTGQLAGNLDPLGALIPGTDEVNPDLTNLTLSTPADDRYSYVQDGSAQTLDHALASVNMLCMVQELQHGRANADFPESLGADPSTVLRASDHDGFVVFLAAPGVTVSPTEGLVTDETGTTASFTVVLDSKPGGTVTIPVSSGDTTEGTVSPSSLNFDETNWDQPQTVIVTGVDDDVADGSVTYTVQVGAATGDTCYAGIDPADVTVTNESKDAVGILADPTSGLIIDEADLTDSYTVVLSSEPTADVDIAVNVSDPSEVVPSSVTLTFTPANWNTPQTVTLEGVPDGILDGDQSFSIDHSSSSDDAAYDGLTFSVTGTALDINTPDDYFIDITVGGEIIVHGPPGALIGLYIQDEDGNWIFLENVQLDETGTGVATSTGLPDSIYGVGGPDNSQVPTGTTFATVPTLGTWGLLAMVMLLMAAAVISNRRKTA